MSIVKMVQTVLWNTLFCWESQLAGKIHRTDHVLYFETEDILHLLDK